MSQFYNLRCDACGIETTNPPQAGKWFELGVSINGRMFLPEWHFCSLTCLGKASGVVSATNLEEGSTKGNKVLDSPGLLRWRWRDRLAVLLFWFAFVFNPPVVIAAPKQHEGVFGIQTVSDGDHHSENSDPVIGVSPKAYWGGWIICGLGVCLAIGSVLCMASRKWSSFGVGVLVGLGILLIAYWLIFHGLDIIYQPQPLVDLHVFSAEVP